MTVEAAGPTAVAVGSLGVNVQGVSDSPISTSTFPVDSTPSAQTTLVSPTLDSPVSVRDTSSTSLSSAVPAAQPTSPVLGTPVFMPSPLSHTCPRAALSLGDACTSLTSMCWSVSPPLPRCQNLTLDFSTAKWVQTATTRPVISTVPFPPPPTFVPIQMGALGVMSARNIVARFRNWRSWCKRGSPVTSREDCIARVVGGQLASRGFVRRARSVTRETLRCEGFRLSLIRMRSCNWLMVYPCRLLLERTRVDRSVGKGGNSRS